MSTLKLAIKKILLFEPFRRWIRFESKLQPRILMYHRISDNPFQSSVTSKEFETQLVALKRNFKIVPLQSALSSPKRSGRPQLVLTFDDGYQDFYTVVWPLLKKHNLAATLFITTGFISGEQWLWPDKIRYILESSKLQNFDQNQLIENWHSLADELLALHPRKRDLLIDDLAKSHQVELPSLPTDEYAALTWDQLKQMQDAGLDIQCHTHRHPILAQLSEEELEDDLSKSLIQIKTQLGKEAWALAYPNGRLCDISETAVTVARSLGIRSGLLARNYDIDDALYMGRIPATRCTTELLWRVLRNETHPQP